MSLRYTTTTGGPAIVLTEPAIEIMMQYRQLGSHHREAGGQLFARFVGVNTEIIEATKPKLLDRRSRYDFRPNRWLQQLEIRDRYKKGLHFVGDWHSHPENCPQPSKEDIDSMFECFTLSYHELRAFVMVVVGREPAPGGLYVALVKEGSILTLILDK